MHNQPQEYVNEYRNIERLQSNAKLHKHIKNTEFKQMKAELNELKSEMIEARGEMNQMKSEMIVARGKMNQMK